MGKCITQHKTNVIIQCIHDSVHFNIHTCTHTPCLLAAHDAMALDDIFYQADPPRIFILASWISLWCHTLPLHSTIESYNSIIRLVEFMRMTNGISPTHSQCMLQGWSGASHFTLPPLPFPPFIMHIHTPMHYIPELIAYSHITTTMQSPFMIISWIFVWYAHEKQSARIRDQTRISRHHPHFSSSPHAFTHIPVHFDIK